MKYSGIIITAIAVSPFASCVKERPAAPQPSPVDTLSTFRPFKGREDDDGGLVMHIVLNQRHEPLSGTLVTIICNGVLFQAVTGESGRCTIPVPQQGDFEVQYFKEGYQMLDTTITLEDSLAVQTVILLQ